MESVPVVVDRVDRSPLQNCTYTKYVVFNLVAVRGKGGNEAVGARANANASAGAGVGAGPSFLPR
jgi:hypothetical protein